MDRFHVVKELAPALFGSIVLCVDKNNGNHVAIKRMQLAAAAKRQANGGPTVQEDLHVEKRVYRHVNKMGGHRNILRLLSSFEEAGHEHFVLEYCHQGDLFTILQSSPHQRLQASQALHYMRQICHGLAFLHSHEIAHGDISLENVLVDANDVAKLMDFGLAVESFHVTQPSSAVGKFFYMPPEMYLGSPYDASKADMWSLGILLLILHTGMPPFARAHSSDNVYASYLKYDIRTLLKGWNVLPHLPVDALDLVERLVVATPDKRLSISDVLRHPYLTQHEALQRHHHPLSSLLASKNQLQHHEPSPSYSASKDEKKKGGVHRFFQKVFRKASSTNQSRLVRSTESSVSTLDNDTPTNNQDT
ncbi:serine/threonine protein kinase, variant 1 [Aphanomyces invadans]|uniref:Serine/threonine protein kinase, variant 1 n=1 Tax=Aphanomyces invadans TaxID=157072 RepID=A0A024T8N2_9STRA|nr:serine/threonine protein kinase, variant 1 [Aphanomyces invadans]ETV90490.1 serine/threonine protein kinase, variant 1 [Aphanomyces invadans]|eukprot:XP_008880878.1 serine/threonine protein kinase, variant 1 [Aphanomyces invadans]